MSDDYSSKEMMICSSARLLAGEHLCFVGVGMPNIACNLARLTVAPELELVYESGVYGADPSRLPLSIGDPTLVAGATSVMSMFDLFSFYLQAGRIGAAFLGAAQIDRCGSINTTVVGEYANPKVRLPGSGGACEIALNAKKTFVIMTQSTKSFVEQLDFVTSPGHHSGAAGAGPQAVVTQLGIYGFNDDGEMRLDSAHPGVSADDVMQATGWAMNMQMEVATTKPPTPRELALIRQELDPGWVYGM